MQLIFLGVNDAGEQIHDWLRNRDDVTVLELIETKENLCLVKELHPDVVVSVGYDYLVPSDILSIPEKGCINLHPSFLPYNRGKSPNVWSIVEDTPAGVTLHYMDEEFDTGEIIAQQKVETDFSDTGKDLHNRLENAQFNLFKKTWPDIETGDIETTSQSRDEGSYHSVQDFRELCEINPGETYQAKELLDILRALTFPPFNNAYIEIDGEKYYIDVSIQSKSKPEENPMELHQAELQLDPMFEDEGSSHSIDDFHKLREIDPNETYQTKELLDILRALTYPPYDNAYIEIDGERYYIEIAIQHEDETKEDSPDGHLTSY